MKDIKKFNSIYCDCADVEDKLETVSLLEEYEVPIADSVYENLYSAEFVNLKVANAKVTDCREIGDHVNNSKVFSSIAFVNKLINCKE